MDNVWTEKEFKISLGYYYFFYLKHAGTKHMHLFVEAFNKENGLNRTYASMSRRFGNYDVFNPERNNTGLNNGGKTCAFMWDKYMGSESAPNPNPQLVQSLVAFMKKYFKGDPKTEAFLEAVPKEMLCTLADIDDEEDVVNSDGIIEDTSINPEYKPETIPELIDSGAKKYKRNRQHALDAIKIAGFKCDLCEGHKSFIGKNGKPYMEAHHLIPLAAQSDPLFAYSLDVIANIVSLCPNCHRKLHHGQDIKEDLKTLLNLRKAKLASSGILLEYEDLLRFYGIND